MVRPRVDVVIPFRGAPAELRALVGRMRGLQLRDGDSVVVVDNTPRTAEAETPAEGRIRVIRAAGLPTPAFARNRGAAEADGDWLVFIDADALPATDLVDRYFDPPPGERTALIGGGIRDEPVPPDGPPAARYAYLRAAMSQDDSFAPGKRWGYPKTANAACRRAAFESVGGFREGVRAAEDADLAYRLRAAGWKVERRERALVVHRNRQTVSAYVKQKALHGAGGAWLDREHPGARPAQRRPGLVWWGVRRAARGMVAAARSRDRDDLLWALLEPIEVLVWEFGRSLPNERPLRGRSPLALLAKAIDGAP